MTKMSSRGLTRHWHGLVVHLHGYSHGGRVVLYGGF